jgi:biotin transport system permease protein
MSLGTYIHRNSAVHKFPAGFKVLALVLGGTAIFLVQSLWIIIALLGVVAALYGVAKVPLRTMVGQVRPAIWIFVVIFLFQVVTTDIKFASLVVTRFIVLILLASLVTLTTPTSKLIEAIERSISWLKWVGGNPSKVSLALSLSLRFIPVVASITSEVREAQRARGLERSILAVAMPVIIRTLKMADDVSNAIDARGYNP